MVGVPVCPTVRALYSELEGHRFGTECYERPIEYTRTYVLVKYVKFNVPTVRAYDFAEDFVGCSVVLRF